MGRPGRRSFSLIDRTIARIGALFCVLFLVLAGRQAWIQVARAGALREEVYNPRGSAATTRGEIVARDGTTLARSVGGARVYPLGGRLAQTVGYASARYGASGLEAAFARDLSGGARAENPLDRVREVLDRRSHAPAATAGRLVTTIDPAIQNALSSELSGFRRGAGVVLDPRNGDVLAVASVPTFDPGTIDARFGDLAADPSSALFNRALGGLYAPGSTFKIVTAATALDAGTVTTATRFSDPGYLDVGNFRVHNDEGEATGDQALPQAFLLSSNVDFARIALTLGVKRFYAGMRAFGVGEPIEFPLEIARDRFSPEDAVVDSTLAQLAFGQADLVVTPMRMALVAAAVANGGVMPKPRIAMKIVDAAGRVRMPAAANLGRAMTTRTAAALNRMMVGVVSQGTGRAAAVPGIFVAGKTGTATNPAGAPHSWFVAFAPADKPTIAIAVVVENSGYGGAVAAPIVKRVIQATNAAR